MRGHSLVECLVALLLLMLLCLMLMPLWQSGRLPARMAVMAFESMVRLARIEALRRGRTVWLCPPVISRLGEIHSCRRRGGDWSAGVLLYVPGDTTSIPPVYRTPDYVRHVPFAAGVRVSSGAAGLAFDADGRLMSSAQVVFRSGPACHVLFLEALLSWSCSGHACAACR